MLIHLFQYYNKNKARDTNYFTKKFINCYCSEWLLVGLSTGRARLVLDPTRTRLVGVRWRMEEPEINCSKNRLSRFKVRVSVGWLLELKKVIEKKKKVIEIWKKLPESAFFTKIC